MGRGKTGEKGGKSDVRVMSGNGEPRRQELLIEENGDVPELGRRGMDEGIAVGFFVIENLFLRVFDFGEDDDFILSSRMER